MSENKVIRSPMWATLVAAISSMRVLLRAP